MNRMMRSRRVTNDLTDQDKKEIPSQYPQAEVPSSTYHIVLKLIYATISLFLVDVFGESYFNFH